MPHSASRGRGLSVAGLQGMGQLDLSRLFGVERLRSGHIEISEKGPADLTAQRGPRQYRISLVPEDRKTEACSSVWTGRRNISLPVINRFTRLGLIDGRAEIDAVGMVLDRLQVQPRALYTRVSAFSGGDQQKIAIAKWLLAESRILLMYDATRGVDIGTKHDIYVLVREFALAGGSVLFFSTEIPELVNLCDRVLVFYQGRIVRELAGDLLHEEAIIRAALGETAAFDARGSGAL